MNQMQTYYMPDGKPAPYVMTAQQAAEFAFASNRGSGWHSSRTTGRTEQVMSSTTIDMAKVTQMLDAGWHVRIYKGAMGSYEVRAKHPSAKQMEWARSRLIAELKANSKGNLLGGTPAEAVDEFHFDGPELMTDDFTPEQALTRMAYKVHGEIL